MDERRRRLRSLIATETEKFLERRRKKILSLKLSNLNINPFMLRAVRQIHGLDTPEAVIDYLVTATLAAGNETAYGWLVDLFLPPLFGAKTPAEREDPYQWEAFKEIDKEAFKPNPGNGQMRRHLISVKAGPMTINDTMAQRMHTNVRGFVEHGNDPVVYAVTYGRRDQLSNKPGIVKGTFPDEKVAILVGREYWDWLAEYKDAHIDIFNGIADGEAAFRASRGESIDVTLRKQKEALVQEFRKDYKLDPDKDMWEQLVQTGF